MASSLLTVVGSLVTGGVAGAFVKGFWDRSTANLNGRQSAERQAADLMYQDERQALDLKGQERRQNAEHAHQRAMLGQAAHFEARKEMAALALDVLNWLNFELLDKFGDEADMFPANPAARRYDDPGEAIGDLRTISVLHPNKAVRDVAARLSGDISIGYNSIADDFNGMKQPDREQMAAWHGTLTDLIERINEPPSRTRG